MLGALQVLGRGNCFADVASFSGMSRSTAEKSFHRFCDCFSAGLWHQWVRLPEGADREQCEGTYRDLGYPGAMGSTDCTHVAWERCPFSETNNHKGKEGFTSVVFEVTCDHTGRIISSTRGYPGAENDKTVVKRDLSVIRIRDDDPWASYKFNLRGLDGTVTEHTGAWLIVDGGYSRVRTRYMQTTTTLLSIGPAQKLPIPCSCNPGGDCRVLLSYQTEERYARKMCSRIIGALLIEIV